MNTAEKTYSDQPLHRDEGVLVADAPTTKGNRPDQNPPDVRLQLSELRPAVDKSADGGSVKEDKQRLRFRSRNCGRSRRRTCLRAVDDRDGELPPFSRCHWFRSCLLSEPHSALTSSGSRRWAGYHQPRGRQARGRMPLSLQPSSRRPSPPMHPRRTRRRSIRARQRPPGGQAIPILSNASKH